MNSWNGVGRLTKDPVKKDTNSEVTICNFTVACNKRVKRDGKPDANFIPCVAFGKTAEFILKWFTKGKMIVVQDAEIETDSFDGKDGKVFTWQLNVGRVEFAGDSSGNGSGAESQGDNGEGSEETRPY